MKRAPKERGRARVASPAAPAIPVPVPVAIAWQFPAAIAAALLLAVWAYSPALNGEFVFDDLHLPFMQQSADTLPLRNWLGLRPLVMFSYWLNFHTQGLAPFAYHVVNLIFHLIASVLFFLVARKVLDLAGMAKQSAQPLAALCAGIFLLHPMQTEAVSYIAQRGESLGALLFFAAWCVFLYRKSESITWPVAAGVLALYAAAVATKEHTVTLPAVLLLTDYFFPFGADSNLPTNRFAAIRRNWRLYIPIALGGLAAAVLVLRYLAKDPVSIGFNLKEFTWSQYLFTEWRVFFAYLGLFLLPVRQSVDYDIAISRSLTDHGAVFGLIGILGLLAAAVYFRKRYPLAAFGFLLFFTMLLPTSSVIPIKDVMADRRLYLPMAGLLFVLAELLRRRRYHPALSAILLLVLAGSTYARNQVWQSSLTLWQDAAQHAPNKQRVQFGLAVAQFRAGRCRDAIESYRRAASIEKPDYTLLMNWSLAYECDHQPEQAAAKLMESIHEQPSAPSWATMGLLYARQGKVPEAMDALMKAQRLDPMYATTYLYRAKIHQAMNQIPEAQENLKVVLALDPGNQIARQTAAELHGR